MGKSQFQNLHVVETPISLLERNFMPMGEFLFSDA